MLKFLREKMAFRKPSFAAVLVGVSVFLVALIIGSGYMRVRVAEVLKQRALTASSVVVGRDVVIKAGDYLAPLDLEGRLARLGYKQIDEIPERAGDFSIRSRQIFIFNRSFQLPDGTIQQEQLSRIDLDGASRVREIVESRNITPISELHLEPEVISFLGTGATRASTPKELSEFPEYLVDAVTSIEDQRFRSHFGIDPIGIIRAMTVNLTKGRLSQGGSTITQQLAKNLFFSNARTLVRKIVEVFAAVLIETAFTKDQILEMYLNEVFLGQEGSVAIHGFGEAAESFFGKDVRDLDLAESATLAGIISAPSAYSPRLRPQAAETRREIVLQKMLSLNKITEEDLEEAQSATPNVRQARRLTRLAPYFVDNLRSQLNGQTDSEGSKALAEALSRMGEKNYTVHSTIDPQIQVCARDALQDGLAQLEKQHAKLKRKSALLQGSIVASDPKTGEVLAWVGGRDYGNNQFDRISNAKRQPGSLFKPFVYLTALDKTLNNYRGARTTMLLDDQPVRIDIPGSVSWEPQNYDDKYRGEVTVREGLVNSLNVPTVGLAMKVGIEHVAQTAEMLGLGENLPRVPSLALGAVEATPLEMLRAYTTLASGGVLLNPRTWVSITVKDEETVLALTPANEGQRVAAAAPVYVLTNILQDVVDVGTGKTIRRLGFSAPAAGKTGTTNEARDAWFAGFTPSLLAIVWVGFDDNTPLGLTGGVAAVPIWTNLMKCAGSNKKNEDFEVPEGVVFKKVDLRSGLLWEDGCPGDKVANEVFVEGTEPVTSCLDYYQGSGGSQMWPGENNIGDEQIRGESGAALPLPGDGHQPRGSKISDRRDRRVAREDEEFDRRIPTRSELREKSRKRDKSLWDRILDW